MDANRRTAYALLCLMPLCFSSNLVFGRATVPFVEPWTLAFLRWSLAFLLLLPLCWKSVCVHRAVFAANWKVLAILGFLGMWICGSVVYFALRYTTATNGTLIYTTSPIIILLLEWLFRGRSIALRELLGVLLAVAGVIIIVTEGSLALLLQLRFNFGDLLIVGAAFSFALYSVLLKRSEFAAVPTLAMFTMVCFAGATTIFPFAVAEIAITGQFPTGSREWANIAGIVVVSSILAFLTYQYGVKTVGPSITGLFMYLLPPFGVGLSVVFLGESLQSHHFVGSAMIMSGLVLATVPADLIRGRARTRLGR